MSEVIVRERYLKNGKKVYEYCFELAHEGGKRRRRTKSGFATKREARAAGRQALYEYENVGEVVVDNNISYSDFLDFWIENDCTVCTMVLTVLRIRHQATASAMNISQHRR